jgi:hypothetical protein
VETWSWWCLASLAAVAYALTDKLAAVAEVAFMGLRVEAMEATLCDAM